MVELMIFCLPRENTKRDFFICEASMVGQAPVLRLKKLCCNAHGELFATPKIRRFLGFTTGLVFRIATAGGPKNGAVVEFIEKKWSLARLKSLLQCEKNDRTHVEKNQSCCEVVKLWGDWDGKET